MSDIDRNATILSGGLNRSVACILLGYSTTPVRERIAQLRADAGTRALGDRCQVLITENVPRKANGEPVNPHGSTHEASETYIYISPIGDRAAYAAGAVTTGNQEGGNGSGGGDVARSAHFLSMIRSDADTTFWKMDSPPGTRPSSATDLATSTDVVSMMNQRTAPNFARVFPSHATAMNYRVVKRDELDTLFQVVLVAAVAVDDTIYTPKPSPKLVDM